MARDLEQYLRTNRDRYTREALTAQAIRAGHDPETVEAAWRAIDDEGEPVHAAGERPAVMAPTPPRRSETLPATILGVAFVVLAWVYLLTSAGSSVPSIALLVVIALLVWRYLRSRDASAADWFGAVVLVGCGVPLILAIGVVGYCLVTGFKLTGN